MNPTLPPRSYFNREILQAVVNIVYEAAMFRASTQSLSKQVGHDSSRYGRPGVILFHVKQHAKVEAEAKLLANFLASRSFI